MDSYYTDLGTSFAAPHVAGGLALLLSAYPDLDVGTQEQALINSAVDLGASGPDDMFGYGRLDLLAAFNWILAVPPTATPTPEVIPSATPVQGPLPTDTPTSLPPSDTPTATNTSVPPTPTYTFTPPPPTATNTPTPTESSVQVIGEVGQVTNLTNTLQTVTLKSFVWESCRFCPTSHS